MNLYSSPFSEIILQQDKNLLIVSWLKDSEVLTTEEVKSEIVKILDYVERHSVKNIIVDSTDYYFSENSEIQSWINYKFMPMILSTPVKKYGFVMKTMSKRYEDHAAGSNDEDLKVAYFPTLNDARKWIDS